jgi:UDP-3-O-[3-hydroxymyristoyl] N-acetylglucosamine deacetylase
VRVVSGVGLHTGAPARVTLRRVAGPVTLAQRGIFVPIRELAVVGTVRATTVSSADSRLRVQTVDHLFAALAGLGVRDGVAIEVEGDELPILDGCSLAWCEAIDALAPTVSPPSLRVVRDGIVETRASRFTFARSDRVEVDVEVAFDDARIDGRASWAGDVAHFRTDIAPSRTFAFAREVEALLARGLARHVPKEAVLVLTDDEVLAAGRPFSPAEPARHKLLDLLGDLYLYGGPPIGRIAAYRPGHGPTHEAMREALARGLVAHVTA